MVKLATQVRGATAKEAYQHFYCPMVPEGGGDWLQPDLKLVNPYFGSQMLRCGELVETFAPTGKGEKKTEQPSAGEAKPEKQPTSDQGGK